MARADGAQRRVMSRSRTDGLDAHVSRCHCDPPPSRGTGGVKRVNQIGDRAHELVAAACRRELVGPALRTESCQTLPDAADLVNFTV